jgi:molybdopterin molybdotransferase
MEAEVLKGQESFRIKSFVKSNIWALLPAGKTRFKKGEIVDCFFPNHSNSALA